MKRTIVLEDLKGIRSRVVVRYEQRGRRGKWASNHLRAYIEYKTKVAGVPVLIVDPRDTSRRCCRYGHVEKRNRVSQSEFRCRGCGFEEDADLKGARNIRWGVEVN
jgi:IS605 OrfB family transposase